MTRGEEVKFSGAIFFVVGALSCFNFTNTYYEQHADPLIFALDALLAVVNYCTALWACRRMQRWSA